MGKLSLFFFMLVASFGFGVAQTAIFPIDGSVRGTHVVNMIATLNSAPYYTTQSEVVIQLSSTIPFPYAPYVVNGLIPYVQSATPATNDTLLIVKYLPPGTTAQYLVVPIEQILVLAYSSVPLPKGSSYTSNFNAGIAPYLSVNTVQRAADIQNVVSTLLNTTPYKSSRSSVALYTTVSGPYNPAIPNSLVTRVQGVTLVSPNDTLLLVTYLANQNIPSTLVLAAEQVQSVVYYPNSN